MSIQFDDLPNWTFSVEESSIGLYVVKGKDKNGRNIEMRGVDVDELVGKCRDFALAIVEKSETKDEPI